MDYNSIRRKTKTVKIGNICIGGDNRIAVQSMLNTDSHDVDKCISQTQRLVDAGCDIVRVAVPDMSCIKTIASLKEAFPDLPIVADIHFDYKLALESVAAGVDKVRINPGNIGEESNVKAVVNACKPKNIPIRIGVNSGSLEKHLLEKYGSPTPEALADSALYNASLLEKYDYNDIVISIKSSSATGTFLANKIVAEKCDYPLHIGVTESGCGDEALIKSSSALGALLLNGIGDTVRISLTDAPEKEVFAAKKLLIALGLSDENHIEVVSCPTCGRTQIDLVPIVNELKSRIAELKDIKRSLKVAAMGCVVNGPGEAKEADIGFAGGKNSAVLIKHGEIVRKIEESEIVEVLMSEIKELVY